MLRTRVFPRLPARATFVAETKFVRDKNFSDLFQKHFVSITNVSRFAQHRNNHEQHCVLVCHHLKSKASGGGN